MKDQKNLIHFLNILGERIKEHQSDIACEISDTLLGSLKSQNKKPPVAQSCSFDRKSLAGFDSNLINLLEDNLTHLNWREAGFGKLPLEISNQVCVSELIGPNGFYNHSSVRIGLLLQMPKTHYPWHQHAAEELYFILGGNADWAVDRKESTFKSSGSFIHHKSNQPHCMTTNDQYMLAVWGWTGDINGSKYSI